MDKEILSTNKAPAAIGPYSQGIAAGTFVFVSGQLPICAATGEMPEDIKAQAEMHYSTSKPSSKQPARLWTKWSKPRAFWQISMISLHLMKCMHA